MEQSPSWEANRFSQLVKKFPAFYGIRSFITAFTSPRHLSLSWANSIQSIPPHPSSWRSILILSPHLRITMPFIAAAWWRCAIPRYLFSVIGTKQWREVTKIPSKKQCNAEIDYVAIFRTIWRFAYHTLLKAECLKYNLIKQFCVIQNTVRVLKERSSQCCWESYRIYSTYTLWAECRVWKGVTVYSLRSGYLTHHHI